MSRIVFLRRSIIILLLILAFTSTVVSAQAPLAPPPVPTYLQASQGTFTDKIRVTWNSVTGATSYKLGTRMQGYSWYYYYPTSSPFDHTGLVPDAVYEYQIASWNGEYSAFSSIVTGYVGVGTPGSVQASDGVYTNKVRVTWTAATNAEYYRVYRGDDCETYTMDQYVGASLEYEDTTAVTGRLYYYTVKGCNDNECGNRSACDTGFRRLAAPQNLFTYDGIFCDYNRVYWSEVPGATYYKVHRGDNVGTYDMEWPFVTDHYFNDSWATASTIYYYSAVACNNIGCSSGSDSDPGYRGVPPAPSGIMATDGTIADRVNIHWTSVLGAQEYRLQRGSSPAVYDTTFPDTVETSFDDYTALPGVTYYYHVSASDNCGWSNTSPADAGSRPASTPTPTVTLTHTPGPSPTPTSTETPGPSPTATHPPVYGVWLPLLLKGDIGG